jgi:hypothetical protein
MPQLLSQSQPALTSKATTSIEVEMVKSGEVAIPAEFQVALYENLLQQIKEKGNFGSVYRDGDKAARHSPNLVVMQATVTAFQEGSERDRQVTTVKGATKITVHCQFTDSQGAVLLQRDIEGKVRFLGDNLKATEDFAKKAAEAAGDAVSAYRENTQHKHGA